MSRQRILILFCSEQEMWCMLVNKLTSQLYVDKTVHQAPKIWSTIKLANSNTIINQNSVPASPFSFLKYLQNPFRNISVNCLTEIYIFCRGHLVKMEKPLALAQRLEIVDPGFLQCRRTMKGWPHWCCVWMESLQQPITPPVYIWHVSTARGT